MTRRRRRLLHPTRGRLLGWLDADDGRRTERLTSHLETCDRCASRLDALVLGDAVQDLPTSSGSDHTGAVGGPMDGDLARGLADEGDSVPGFAMALRDAWSVPDELPDRIHRAIDRRAQADRELDLLLGLVSIGTETAQLLLPDAPTHDSGDPVSDGFAGSSPDPTVDPSPDPTVDPSPDATVDPSPDATVDPSRDEEYPS